MSLARYLLGFAALLTVLGSLGATAVVVRRRYLPEWDGALARLAEAVVGLAVLTGVLELLGAVGWLRPAAMVIVSVAVAVGTASVLRRGTAPGGSRGVARGGFRPWYARSGASRGGRGATSGFLVASAVALAVAAAAAVAAEWATPTLDSYNLGVRTFDSLWYHLPWAASFAQTGQITSLRFTDVEYLTAFYPASLELLHGAGIVLLGYDTVSPGMNLVWLGLVLLAGWCVGRSAGVAAGTVLGAAVAMATPMVRYSQAGSAANDAAGVFFLLAAAAFILAVGRRHQAAGRALGGLAAGLAIGVKLSMLAPALALTAGALCLAPRGGRRAAAVHWLVPLALVGGFWYARNLIAVGNPLPWFGLLGLPTPAPPLEQHTGFSVLHYLPHTKVWGPVFGPGLLAGLGDGWPVMLALVVVGPILCLAPPARSEIRVLALAALASLLAYLATPETAAGPAGHPLGFAFNLRYGAPALALALTVTPLAPVLTGRRVRIGVIGAFVALLVVTLTDPGLWPSNDLLGSIIISVTVAVLGLAAAAVRMTRTAGARGANALPATGSGASAGRVLTGGRRQGAGPAAALVLAATLATVILLAALGFGGYVGQRHYLRVRYAIRPGSSSLSAIWAYFRGVHHARVAVVGTFGGFMSYPLYGLDATNHVEYVARRGPHGSFTPITSCREWRGAVNRGRFRYVVTTPARSPWHPTVFGASPEGTWTAGDPAAQTVYAGRALGQPISIFRLRGPLNPAGCRG